MDIFLVWGFLGSGKTTLINHLLSSDAFAGKTVVVLENESGKESVDGEMLKSRRCTVVDLKGGCMCCTLRLKLVDTLHELEKQFRPDVVLIESSGLASLEEMKSIPHLSLSGVLSVLDVTQYDFLMKLNPAFYKRQFYFSSVIFLTKTDLTDEDRVAAVSGELMACQPLLHIVPDYRKLDAEGWEEVWTSAAGKQKLFLPLLQKNTVPSFVTETFYLESPLDADFFMDSFPAVMKAFGDTVVRAKGLVKGKDGKWGKFDYVGGHADWTEMDGYQGQGNGFLAAWWDSSCVPSPAEWLVHFLNAAEVPCVVSDLKLDDKDLCRYLAFDPKDMGDDIVAMVEQLKTEAYSLCRPRLGFRLVSGSRVDKEHLTVGGEVFTPARVITRMLQDADFYAMLVASVGQELDGWIGQKRTGGDVMEAFVADAIGSAITEAIVVFGQRTVEQFLAKWNLKTSNTYSPGYCDWDVSEQRKFFALFPEKFCGVSLTESCLMMPIKSISTLMGVGKGMQKKPYGCAICKMKDCYKRSR